MSAVQLVTWAHSPGRYCLPIEIVASMQKIAYGVCFKFFVDCPYPEVCLG